MVHQNHDRLYWIRYWFYNVNYAVARYLDNTHCQYDRSHVHSLDLINPQRNHNSMPIELLNPVKLLNRQKPPTTHRQNHDVYPSNSYRHHGLNEVCMDDQISVLQERQYTPIVPTVIPCRQSHHPYDVPQR